MKMAFRIYLNNKQVYVQGVVWDVNLEMGKNISFASKMLERIHFVTTNHILIAFVV